MVPGIEEDVVLLLLSTDLIIDASSRTIDSNVVARVVPFCD